MDGLKLYLNRVQTKSQNKMQMSKNIKGNQPQFLNGWTEAVFKQGIVFIAPFYYRKEDVIAIYNQHEDWFI